MYFRTCVCVLSCQQGFQTPIAPHWGILTLSLLDSLHPNIPPSDCPYVTPLLHFCSRSSLLFSPLLFSVRKEKRGKPPSFVFIFRYAVWLSILCLRVYACLHKYWSFCLWSLPVSFIMCILFIIHFWIYVWMRRLASCLFVSAGVFVWPQTVPEDVQSIHTYTNESRLAHSHAHKYMHTNWGVQKIFFFTVQKSQCC